MITKRKLFNHGLIPIGLILVLFPLLSTSQVNVIHLSDNKAISDKDGIFYSLPRTVINVSFVVNKIQKTKGPYADYADTNLGITNIITNNSTEYELSEVSLTTTAKADPKQLYFMELDDKSSRENKSIEIYLSEAGFIQDVSTVSKLKNSRKDGSSKQQESGNVFADFLNPSLLERVDTVVRGVSVDPTILEQKFFRKMTSENNIEQKAKEAADIIIELDEYMLNLLSGYQEVGYGTNLEYMYNQLEAMKAEYLALFKGIKLVTTTTFHYSFIPKPDETEQDTTLCKFSKIKGIVENSISGGNPVTIVMESQGLTQKISDYIKSKNSRDKRLYGFSYRVPDNAKISIKVGDQIMLEAVVGVNQLGVISTFTAGDFSSIRLHPATGSIKRVILK